MSKETYSYGQRGLLSVKRDLFIWSKRPTNTSIPEVTATRHTKIGKRANEKEKTQPEVTGTRDTKHKHAHQWKKRKRNEKIMNQ